jgi:hypothetical protein
MLDTCINGGTIFAPVEGASGTAPSPEGLIARSGGVSVIGELPDEVIVLRTRTETDF